MKNWLIWKDPDAGKDWGQEEKDTTQDEMAGWHHWLNGHEFEYTPGVGDGQGGLECCSPWGRKELDMTEQLNWTELNWTVGLIFILTGNTKWFIFKFQIYWGITDIQTWFLKCTCMPQLESPHAATSERTCPRARAPQQGKPTSHNLRTSMHRNQEPAHHCGDPEQPNKNKTNKCTLWWFDIGIHCERIPPFS